MGVAWRSRFGLCKNDANRNIMSMEPGRKAPYYSVDLRWRGGYQERLPSRIKAKHLPLQRLKRFVPVATVHVRTIVAKLCFTLKLLAVTANQVVAMEI